AGKYAEAAVKLEQAAKANPNDARIWWQINFTYHKLHRDADALAALQKAGTLDPSHRFTSDPAKYDQTLTERQQDVGKSSSAPSVSPSMNTTAQPTRSGSTTAGSGSGNLTQQLINGDVYAEPGMNVDIEGLRAVAQRVKPTVVKFAIFNSN